MSLLAALTLDLDLTMIPASTMSCRPELLKHRLPHAGHSELLPGPVDQGFALGMERPVLTGDGFSDWMTERTDLATLLSVSGESSPISLPSPPAPDLEAMASLLKKELEQMEDYFLEETLSPDQISCIFTSTLLVASSGFLSSRMRRNLGKRKEMPFSSSTCKE